MTETASPQSDITARAGTYYRVTRYLMVAMFIAMGLWFAYDGFINWPRVNEEARQKDPGGKAPHSQLDILIQKILAFSLPPLGIAMLVWTLYNSRGTYQLSGTTLTVPGHPPIPLDNIRRIDKKLWDRKGIAYIDYERTGPQDTATFKLDDFVYQREGTDEIFKRIEEYLFPPGETATTGDASPIGSSDAEQA